MRFREQAELLAHANWLVGRGEALCAQQAALLVRQRTWGHETEAAEAVLVRLELTLTEMRLYRAHLEADAQKPTA